MNTTLDVDRFCISISNYIDKEVAPQYDGLLAFGVRMFSNVLNRNGINIINHFSSILKACKLMTSDDKIDIDEFSAVASATFDQIGKISIGGLSYSKKDLDRLIEIMKSYIPPNNSVSSLNNGSTPK